jgi:cell division protein FtsB
VRQTVNRDDRLAFLKDQISRETEKELKLRARAEAIQESIDGYAEENPIGRFARVRAIPDIAYYFILILLACGEVLVTGPALITLFDELDWAAYIIAFATGLLTVVYAHILGISLKMKLDRQKPQENWVIKTLIPISVIIFVAIMSLAFLRSGQVYGQLKNFNVLTDDWAKRVFLVIFFVFVQLAFIGVATKLAFLHYSQQEHELRKAKRSLAKVEKERKNLADEFSTLASESILSEDLIDIAREELKAKIALIASNYSAAAAIYCDANIHARRDEINASHPSLIPPDFNYQPDEFSDLKELAKEYLAREKIMIR